ncbi:MAG: leucine-rich repeat protein [Clostridia bacterium]|nr:leucine-rich repeat protein [Clostridia bacterium]
MKKICLICLTVLIVTVLMSGCTLYTEEGLFPDETKPAMKVSVMLQDAEGMTVMGENPVVVEAGSDVSFPIQIHDGYKIETVPQGVTYENGVITLPSVRFPTTLEVETRLLNDLEIKLQNNAWQGTVTANVEDLGSVKEDTEVTLSVTTAKGVIFLGYSVGATRVNGGTIVCTSPEYTFTATENMELYTNYYLGTGSLVIYDSNGGNEPQQYYVFSSTSPYIGPNALANKGQFTKEGHVLYGYNTEPDGSGTYYGPGWSVIMPANDAPLTLYAQWMPETEKDAFTYKVSGKQVMITKYKGSHETVVIPETIDGMPVTRIGANAFVNGKFKTLYLSRNLRNIDDNAFVACRSLTTLYLCDTPSGMTDNSFSKCDELQKLYMLACLDPRYSLSNNGTYKVKYQRLITAEGKKIIFHAGSNVSYGIDIETIQDALGGAYAGVNFGCNISTPAIFYMEVATAHMNEGDIIVLCPEYGLYQYGYNEMNTTTWQIFEGAYNAYADVDIRNYIKVFSSFAAFNTNRYNSTPRTYEQFCTAGGDPAVTKFGEYNVNHNGQTSALKQSIAKWTSNSGNLNIDMNLLNQSYNANMNAAIDMVNAKGGKVYISFAATMKQWLSKESQNPAVQNAFKNAVVRRFPKAAVISDPGTYVLDQSYFYNSQYHLSTQSSVYRAKLLAQDILAQFAKEK